MTTMTDTPSTAQGEAMVLARPAFEAVIKGLDAGPHRVAVDCEPDLRLPAQVVETLGLVVGEAVDNALRHAFPNHIEGRVWVRLFHDRGRLTLTVRDNGIGMPDFEDYDSGGRARIFAAAEALHAQARMGVAPFSGALVSITFPA